MGAKGLVRPQAVDVIKLTETNKLSIDFIGTSLKEIKKAKAVPSLVAALEFEFSRQFDFGPIFSVQYLDTEGEGVTVLFSSSRRLRLQNDSQRLTLKSPFR